MLHCCGFFNKYENSNHIDCRGFIQSYCKGRLMNNCARMEYFLKHNELPSDDMLPSGKMIECDESVDPYSDNSQQYF